MTEQADVIECVGYAVERTGGERFVVLQPWVREKGETEDEKNERTSCRSAPCGFRIQHAQQSRARIIPAWARNSYCGRRCRHTVKDFLECSTGTLSLCVNLSESEVDKREMLARTEFAGGGLNSGRTPSSELALELLAGCGMISGAGLETPSGCPRSGVASPSKDYTLAILESLNLSARKRV